MNPRYPLQIHVRRVLVRRLGMCVLATALVFAAGAWLQARGRVQDEAVRVAGERLDLIRAIYAERVATGSPPQEAVASAVDAVAAMISERRGGRFCRAVFFDRDTEFHVYRDSTAGLDTVAAAVVAEDRAVRPQPGEARSRLVTVDGHRAVSMVLPVAEVGNRAVAWVAAVYVLSPETAGQLTSAPVRAAVLVVLVVLATAAVLYPVIQRLAARLAALSSDLLEANLEMLEVLGCAVAKRDSDTDAHNYRVTVYAVRLAEHVGLAVPEIQSLVKGAFLHDVGKIGIRDDVLLKPGRLDEAEYEVMRGHVEHGVDIVCRATWLQDALAVVASHHEKFDGAGYPRNVPGREIPVAARIFAVVDVFDALASPRPYKDALSLEESLATLEKGRGTHFDPELLDRFVEIAPELHAELAAYSPGQLRGAVQAINERYFTAAPEAVLV